MSSASASANVYDKDAENNTRWVNINVKAFGEPLQAY